MPLMPSAETVHAGVHFEENPVRLLRLMGGQHVNLLGAMNGVPQPEARAQLEVACFKAAFQQQNRAAPVERAQAPGFVQVEKSKPVSAAQRIKNTLDAVAVGIRLDNRPHPGIRCGSPRARQIVTQGCGVNGGKNGTWHGAIKKVKNEVRAVSGQRTSDEA